VITCLEVYAMSASNFCMGKLASYHTGISLGTRVAMILCVDVLLLGVLIVHEQKNCNILATIIIALLDNMVVL